MHLDFWDYLTFASFFVCGIGTIAAVVFVLGLPGRIAYARKHPDAEAINIMGWLGFLVVVPYVHAFIWAFKPTNVVDVRRFPKEEKEAIEADMRKHFGPTYAAAMTVPTADADRANDAGNAQS